MEMKIFLCLVSARARMIFRRGAKVGAAGLFPFWKLGARAHCSVRRRVFTNARIYIAN